MNTNNLKAVQREILLGFWKAHILYHASEGPVVGQWMLRELRRHGYDVSPGTIYPLLARLQEHGWLKCKTDPSAGPRARKEYSLTQSGKKVLALLRKQVEELHREVVLGEDEKERKEAQHEDRIKQAEQHQ
jgi:PadR family transcriptional regulator PadR